LTEALNKRRGAPCGSLDGKVWKLLGGRGSCAGIFFW